MTTHELLKRPELKFSLNRLLGQSEVRPARSVGDSVADYYGATLSRRVLLDATKERCIFRKFTFDDSGVLFLESSSAGGCCISWNVINPYLCPDGPLELHSGRCVDQLRPSSVAFASAGETIAWTSSGDHYSAQPARAHLRRRGECPRGITRTQDLDTLWPRNPAVNLFLHDTNSNQDLIILDSS